MTEALYVVLEYGFNTLNFKNIEAFTHFQNSASIALLVNNGFQLLINRKDNGNENNRIFSLASQAFN